MANAPESAARQREAAVSKRARLVPCGHVRRVSKDLPVMSGVEYAVDPCSLGWALRMLSPSGGSTTIDYVRTSGAARWAARELAAGQAHVEPHQPLGCKVQPGPKW